MRLHPQGCGVMVLATTDGEAGDGRALGGGMDDAVVDVLDAHITDEAVGAAVEVDAVPARIGVVAQAAAEAAVFQVAIGDQGVAGHGLDQGSVGGIAILEDDPLAGLQSAGLVQHDRPYVGRQAL